MAKGFVPAAPFAFKSKPIAAPAATNGVAFLKSLRSTTRTDCITWPFSRNPVTGYGYLTRPGTGRQIGAHRYMCILMHGDPPPASRPGMGAHAAHSCGNGHLGCVNPNHLRWATPLENSLDTIRHALERDPDFLVNEHRRLSALAKAAHRRRFRPLFTPNNMDDKNLAPYE